MIMITALNASDEGRFCEDHSTVPDGEVPSLGDHSTHVPGGERRSDGDEGRSPGDNSMKAPGERRSPGEQIVSEDVDARGNSMSSLICR